MEYEETHPITNVKPLPVDNLEDAVLEGYYRLFFPMNKEISMELKKPESEQDWYYLFDIDNNTCIAFITSALGEKSYVVPQRSLFGGRLYNVTHVEKIVDPTNNGLYNNYPEEMKPKK